MLKSNLHGVLVSLFAATVCASAAAPGPAEGKPKDFFGPTNLCTFHLIFQPAEWAKMEPPDRPGFGRRGGPPGPPGLGGTETAYKKGKATLQFEGKEWGEISVRFKGNSSFMVSRFSLKRPFKLDFNDTDKGKTFFGMTKLNLSNGAMDPSVLREALGYDVFRRAGIPASRTAFAKVFITVPGLHEREYAGLYTAVEQVDGTFLKEHFGAKNGLLLKPERVNGLPYLGEDWAAYRYFEEKSNAKPAQTKRFISFVRLVEQADDAAFAAQINGFLDVERFLRFLAVEAVLSNLDSPLLTGHNYYLHLNPATQKVELIPWDLNEAFGGFMGSGTTQDMIDLNIHKPFAPGFRLAQRVLALPGAIEKYDEIMRGLLATNFTAQRLSAELAAMAAVVRQAVKEDRTIRIAEFERHLSENPVAAPSANPPPPSEGAEGGFGPPGRGGGPGGRGGGMGRQKPPLRQFLERRVESIREQLEGKRQGYTPTRMGGFGRGGGPGQRGPGRGPGAPLPP